MDRGSHQQQQTSGSFEGHRFYFNPTQSLFGDLFLAVTSLLSAATGLVSVVTSLYTGEASASMEGLGYTGSYC
jgi:hypothetical protein